MPPKKGMLAVYALEVSMGVISSAKHSFGASLVDACIFYSQKCAYNMPLCFWVTREHMIACLHARLFDYIYVLYASPSM
jgi:hypothetical protein